MPGVRNSLVVVLLLIATFMSTTLPFSLLRASSPIILSLAVSANLRSQLDLRFVDDFAAENPGIKIDLVSADYVYPDASQDTRKYLEGLEQLARAGDVILVDSFLIMEEATRTGYFLDLSPLTRQDAALKPSDFYTSAWQSFRWDGAMWALPLSVSPTLLIYEPAAFDQAGLAYPNEHWTLADLSNAIHKLAGNSGSSKYGVILGDFGQAALIRSLANTGFYDPATVPNPPALDNPTLENQLESWAQLYRDALIGQDTGVAAAPLSVGTPASLAPWADPDRKRAGILLPGGHAPVMAYGFAVSSGTAYPEQAYALARFLIGNDTFIARFTAHYLDTIPARRSQKLENASRPGVQALVEQALEQSIPASEMRYGDYITLALNKMTSENLDAGTALHMPEDRAVASLKAASENKGKTALAVATPIPVTPGRALAPGQILLKFGVVAPTIPNREL